MISTQNLNIRRFSDRDFENLRTLEADPEVMRFTGPGRVQSTAESKVNLVRFLEPMGNEGYWGVEDLSSKIFMGFLMLKPDAQGDIELGFMFVRSSWGRGFATEAARALIRWHSEKSNTSQYVAKTDLKNFSSQRVLQKIGFIQQDTPASSSSKTLVIYKLSL